MNEIQKSNGGNLLEKGLDVIKDPNASTSSKVGAVALTTIGAVTLIGGLAIKAMSGSK